MLPQRLTNTIRTTIATVSTIAVNRNESHPNNVGVTSRFIPATFSPPKTLHRVGPSSPLFLAGQQLLLLFGISLQSFMIAGEMLLLLLSVEILLRGERVQKTPGEGVGIVPIAFPLLVGPGAITTTMISIQSYGLEVAIPSILIVMFLTWVVLRLTDRINRLLGRTGSAVVARVLAVFIAAIAIQFIIDGIQTY